MRDSSLNDFLDDDGEETAASAENVDGEEPQGGDRKEDIEPARPTATFDPDGTTCKSCGAVVKRLWRDGDATVCDDCKQW